MHIYKYGLVFYYYNFTGNTIVLMINADVDKKITCYS